jgi:hypothetical protein
MVSNIEIKCFKVDKLIPQRFTLSTLDEGETFVKRHNVDWSDNNNLTQALNNQVKNNFLDAYALWITANGYIEKEIEQIFTIGKGGSIVPYLENKTESEKVKICKDYLRLYDEYREVTSRDQDALEQKNFNVVLYAIVLLQKLSNGEFEYHGHIYGWQSPKNKELFFGMGIRNRSDSLFRKAENRHFSNVSGFLLEGLRRLCLNLNSSKCIIVSAKKIMTTILPKYGFEKFQISGSNFDTIFIVGISIAKMLWTPLPDYCLSNIETSIMDCNIKVTVY